MSRPFNQESFEQKFDKVDGCWEWHATKNPDGYGRVRRYGRLESAHRIVYELYKGPLGDKQVLHKCDNPSCVNPEHLFLGTIKENNQDKARKGRARGNRMPGMSHPSSKLTDEDVRSIRQDPRSQSHLSRIYGVSPSLIGGIKNRTRWSHVT